MNALHDKPISVLLIEDNAGDARLIREMMKDVRDDSFRIKHVTKLKTGLKWLSNGGSDVVLLDLSLPDSQGLNTLLRAQEQSPSVPIVVLTGLEDETIGVEAVQRGAQDYLVKGQVDANLLARAIKFAIERQQMQEDLRERENLTRMHAEQLAVLHDISRQISSTLDTDRVVTSVVQGAVKLLGADRSELLLMSPDCETLQLKASFGSIPDPRERPPAGASRRRGDPSAAPRGRLPSELVVQEGKPVLVGDVRQDGRCGDLNWVRRLGFLAYIGVPLVVCGEVTGVLDCVSATPNRFEESDFEPMEVLAAHAAVAMGNARAFEETRMHLERQEALRRVIRDIMQKMTLEVLFSRICESVCRLLKVEMAFFFIIDKNAEAFNAVGSFGESESDKMPIRTFPKGKGLTHLVASRKETITVADISSDPNFINREWAARNGCLQGYLGIPILLGDQVVGVLSCLTNRWREFKPEEIDLMKDFGDHAVIALENARAHSALGWALTINKEALPHGQAPCEPPKTNGGVERIRKLFKEKERSK